MKTLPSAIKPSPNTHDASVDQKAARGLEELADRLRSLGVRYATVFGSVAAKQARPDSDIDVAVLARGPLRTADRERFMTAIAESTGRSVDLIDLSTARGLLLDRALGGREIVCDSTATRSELIVRKLRAADDCRVAEIAAKVARTRLFE
jgi:predicted nucleotidyltransferase